MFECNPFVPAVECESYQIRADGRTENIPVVFTSIKAPEISAWHVQDLRLI